MDLSEYERMFKLEDSHWWFQGTRYLVQGLWSHYRGRLSPAGTKALDLGCGTGRTLESLPDPVWAVGADSSDQALRFCRERGLARLMRVEAEALPIRDSVFDLALVLDLIEHAESDRAVVEEAVRVLRPRGLLILTVPAGRLLWGEHDRALGHRRRYRREELEEILSGLAVKIEKISYFNFFLFLPILLYRRLGRKVLGPGSGSDLFSFPPGLNAGLSWLLRLEAKLAERVRFPVGVSLFAVARKE